MLYFQDKALNKLQLVLYPAARILTRTQKCDPMTPVESLHWLSIKARADFNVILLIYKALHGLAPSYFSDLAYPHVCYVHKMQASLLALEFLSKQLEAGLYRAPFLW